MAWVVAPVTVAMAQDVTCYVDSVAGDDGRSGPGEAEAVKSPAKIVATCAIVSYKRGSVFHEAVKITNRVKTYDHYGDAEAPLPLFGVPHASNSGSLVKSSQGGITTDGLSLPARMATAR